MSKDPIYVTQPYLPPMEEFIPYLEQIWKSKILTNGGDFHQQLEQELCDYLGVKYISLFSNGTLALITALQALRITGEVITTPFSFVATTHSLWWNNIKPVFADIDPTTFNLDPDKIEAAITPKTSAIMPVHVYGNPCNLERIQEIADNYNLKVIYDAAHAFGVKKNGQSVLNYGDLSVLSFHATKVFNTFEGGAIVCHDAQMKRHIDDLKNFGFRDEVTVVAPGINAKMNEVQAAMGLLQLKYIDSSIEKRKAISELYQNKLKDVLGIELPLIESIIDYNYSYFPIFVNKDKYGKSRDELYDILKKHNIYGRRYFYPLISQFSTYRGLESAQSGNLSNAEKIAERVICLPIFPDLDIEDFNYIVEIIKS
jgi:dTDP-4-amino-4,6-dideoxygalactose transaminase